MISVLLMFVLVNLALTSLSVWAERDVGAHPFKSEDWLRYLLPSRLSSSSESRILLAGPSTVRENLRFEQFETAFPDYEIFQGGISAGTIEDTLTAVQYLELTRDQAVLPEIIVLGVSPRFIAGYPLKRSFRIGIDLYSPHYQVVELDGDFELVAKGPIERLNSTILFFSRKQPERYRTALFATAYHWLSRSPHVSAPLERMWASKFGAVVSRARAGDHKENISFLDRLEHRISPYKYTFFEPKTYTRPDTPTKQNVTDAANADSSTVSWWPLVYNWDAASAASGSRRLAELVAFTDRNDIRLLVINMPERGLRRDLYSDRYQNYLDMVTTTVGEARFVDLREFLTAEEFYDLVHTTTEGSRRLTKEVVGYVQTMVNEGEM